MSPTAGETLLVLLHGEVAGEIVRDGGGRLQLTYSPQYASSGRVALSARLPLQRAPHGDSRVLPFLAGLVPEHRETRIAWASRLSSEEDPFSLLAEMGWDCPGAVQFCRPEALDQLGERSGEHVAVDEATIEKRLRDLTETSGSWTLPDEHWSLGGQQEKIALALLGGQWHEAHGSAATTHIIKPGIKRLHHQALVEHATMRAAATLGVNIAESAFTRFGDQWAIVVTRFDRDVPAGGVTRIHQEDFCQAAGRMPEDKYESPRGPTFRDMCSVVERESSFVESDRRALADFLAINVVAGAPDGHSKNISLVRSSAGNWVAPLYDLATALSYDSDQVERSVAVAVGGERRFSRIRSAQWAKAAALCSLSPGELEHRVLELAGGFPGALAQVLHELSDVGAPGADEVLERSLPAVRTHCIRLVDQIGG